MSYRDLFDMAKKNLLARKLRTGLTLLGVVIGCVSIIIMLSFGYGMTDNNRKMMGDFGDVKNIQVMSGDNVPNNQGKTPKKLTTRSLRDFRKIPHVVDVTPVYNTSVSMKMRKYESDFVNITAMDKSTFSNMDWSMDSGSSLHGDGKGQLLFGSAVANNFYNPKEAFRENSMTNEEDDAPPFHAAGKNITLSSPSMDMPIPGQATSESSESVDLKVTGVIAKTKKMEYDNTVFMTTEGYMDLLERLKLPKPARNNYEKVQVRIDDIEYAEDVSDAIRDLGYEPTGMLELIKSMNKAMSIVNAIFAGIGSISFVVAAIGIANTMIMSIYERTREIGVMKVIGASIQDIQKLFLTEAALIGFIGGILGVIISLLMSTGFNLIGNRIAQANGAEEAVTISQIPSWLIIVALLFSTAVGIAAGYFPAKRAMNLSALDAIRSE